MCCMWLDDTLFILIWKNRINKKSIVSENEILDEWAPVSTMFLCLASDFLKWQTEGDFSFYQ
jgi:hypothetical protein